MGVYGCSGSHPDLDPPVGHPRGRRHRRCFDDLRGLCHNGHALVVGQTGESVGDWRLPDRLRLVEGVEPRLAELARMRAETEREVAAGIVTRLELSYLLFYERVVRGEATLSDR